MVFSSKENPDSDVRQIILVDSLKALVEKEGMDKSKLSICIPLDENDRLQIEDRGKIILSDEKEAGMWILPSIRAIFRGDRKPPTDSEMGRYPEEYVEFFYGIERSIVSLECEEFAPYDHEFIEVYSAMRRRPDGKSSGLLHDIVWQSAALALGLREWSEAEYSSVFRQLERSARHFQTDSVSRNYFDYVTGTFD